MYKILRQICCIIGVILLACCVLVGIFFGFEWALICVAGAILFGGLTVLFKNLDEKEISLKDNFIDSEEKLNEDEKNKE